MAEETEERLRALRPPERHEAWRVFGDSLPYHRIFICDQFGAQERACMIARSGYDNGDYYVLKLGPTGYENAISDDSIYGEGYDRMVRTVFIHELTHVWQSFRGTSVMASSVASQAYSWLKTASFAGAYVYVAGRKWEDYNVEQQAKIVEDWYMQGMPGGMNLLFGYIRDNIRK